MNILTRKGSTLVGSLIAITILSTTFVLVMNLQASILKAKFFMQYDNTANLLASEGVEIVRAIYNQPNASLADGTYQVDHTTTTLDNNNKSTCTDSSINNSCDLELTDTTGTSYYKLSNTTGNKEFNRFVTITIVNAIPKVTSTVVVRNPRGGNLRVYKTTIELYRIN